MKNLEKLKTCYKNECIRCMKKDDCHFSLLMTNCMEMVTNIFMPLEDDLKSKKFTELLIMLGYAVKMLRTLGLEGEFLDFFPVRFRELVKVYLESVNIQG